MLVNKVALTASWTTYGDAMGSTGSGSFSDYTGAKNPVGAGRGGGSGGASGSDRCSQAFSCVLEEVAQCDHYTNTGAVPAAGDVLQVVRRGRLFAINSTGATVGALPTRLNYLAACLEDGFTYVGVIRSSSLTPFPTIEADFAPQNP